MPGEFWEEEVHRDRGLVWKTVVRWLGVFGLLFLGVLFAFWRTGSAIHFGASRVNESTPASYRVFGDVRSSATGDPVPWAVIEDDSSGRPPLYRATADYRGVFELMTIAEPHAVRVSALGFKAASMNVGKVWYLWMPRGEERANVKLEPE